MKIVWICHFTNDYIQQKLKVKKRISEFAPWITLGIEEVKKREDIELHIVSPHRWINRSKEFIEDNIHYHFFNPGIPFYGRHWPGFFRFDIYTKFWNNKTKVRRIVDKIKPDIIHLHGFENAYYSSTIFPLKKKYPIFITVQGFITLQLKKPISSLSRDMKIKILVEKKILNNFDNFGIRDNFMKKEILKYNKNAKFFYHEYFLNINSKYSLRNLKKIYDIIFYARVTRTKGIEDLIDAVGILKNDFPKITVAVIGQGTKEYIGFLKNKILENNLNKNISLLGFLPTQEDIFNVLEQSKMYVIPAYNGDVNGGAIESMTRKIPVIVNDVGGFKYLNEKDEVALIAKKGDINDLASKIRKLLIDDNFREQLSERAYYYAINRWNNEKALSNIIEAYKTILSY